MPIFDTRFLKEKKPINQAVAKHEMCEEVTKEGKVDVGNTKT